MKHQDYHATAGLLWAALKIGVIVGVPLALLAVLLKFLGVMQ